MKWEYQYSPYLVLTHGSKTHPGRGSFSFVTFAKDSLYFPSESGAPNFNHFPCHCAQALMVMVMVLNQGGSHPAGRLMPLRSPKWFQVEPTLSTKLHFVQHSNLSEIKDFTEANCSSDLSNKKSETRSQRTLIVRRAGLSRISTPWLTLVLLQI